MEPTLFRALQARRALIRQRWEVLLRQQHESSPLTNPDTLIHLIEWAIERIFMSLESKSSLRTRSRTPQSTLPGKCECGQNPLVAFYLCGEQAVQEALLLIQTEIASSENAVPITPKPATELYRVVRQLAVREMDSFCAVCRGRSQPKTGSECSSP